MFSASDGTGHHRQKRASTRWQVFLICLYYPFPGRHFLHTSSPVSYYPKLAGSVEDFYPIDQVMVL